MKKQFTASCYIVSEGKFLLIFHPKFKKWLAPGGHMEENETPPETARREVREETGLEIEFLSQENLWVDEWNSKSFERPFSCLLGNVPEHKGEAPHQHMDFVYVGKPVGGELTDGKWFSPEEVAALKTHDEIFFDTKAAIESISNVFSELVI